jgi:anti-anti-sigma regulatory factor
MDEGFRYLIASEGPLVLLTLMGDFSGPELESKLDELFKQIAEKAPRLVVINFREVSVIPRSSYRFLVKLQGHIRKDLFTELRCCGLAPEIRETLFMDSVLRKEEFCNNLKSALVLIAKRSAA